MKTVEELLIGKAEGILTGAVNFYLSEMEELVPLVELSSPGKLGAYGVCPHIELTEGERTDKDRIVRADAYKLTITLTNLINKRDVYCYAAALESAINDDPTFGGLADRVEFVKRAYFDTKAVFVLRVTVGK